MVCGGLLFLSASIALAHEHWIDADRFFPGVGETVNVHLRSGHYFPRSSFAIKDAVLHEIVLRTLAKDTFPIETSLGEREREGTVSVKSDGVHLATFCLKRPRAKEPNYEGKTIIVVGGKDGGPGAYTLGHGLELILGRTVSGLRPGDELPVTVSLDGVPVAASLAVTPENGRRAFVIAETDRPGVIKLQTSGRYLVTASIAGRGCSLVFHVREAKGKGR